MIMERTGQSLEKILQRLGCEAGLLGISGVSGNFTFSNMPNLVGGNNGNRFIFANGTNMTGTLNGGSFTQENIIGNQFITK